MSDQWTPPPAPGYGYPQTRPQQGYYAYPTGSVPPPPDYEHHYEPHGQAYGYNPYAFAPPPTPQAPAQSGYYPPPPKEEAQEAIKYKFVRAEHQGWHVYDPCDQLIFDVTYKKAGMFKHDGCEVHHGIGGPVLVTVYDETLTAGSFTSKIKRKSSHDDKMCFDDPHSHSYIWSEVGAWDNLLLDPSKEPVAKANVNILSGKGSLEITDPKDAPDAPVLVAAYVELLRKQKSDYDFNKGFKQGAMAGVYSGVASGAF